MRLRWVCLLICLLLVGCSSDPIIESASSDEPVAQGSAEVDTAGLELCGEDPGRPTAPADWYRDQPKYVGNEQPTEAVLAWAQTRPGFQEVWVDRENNGWVTVGFASDVDARQAEIAELFPNDGVVAVLLDVDLAALRQLQNEISAALQGTGVSASWSVSPTRGKVAVNFGLLSDKNLAPLRPFAGRAICVSGGDPAGARIGPQIDGGDGWRLLMIDGSARRSRADVEAGQPPPTPGGLLIGRQIEIATSQPQLNRMWHALAAGVDTGIGPDEPVPVVDFEREIVVVGNAIESGSCPLLVFGITTDLAEPALLVDTATSDDDLVCTADANPLTWALAVERSELPPAPFEITNPDAGTLWVEADLRDPFTTVDDLATIGGAATGPNPTPAPVPSGFEHDARPAAPPRPDSDSEPAPQLLPFPHVIEPGFASGIDLPRSCVAALGPLNSYVWVPENAALASGDIPDDWLIGASTEAIPVELLLNEDPQGQATLEVSANGRTERYVIADELSGC